MEGNGYRLGRKARSGLIRLLCGLYFRCARRGRFGLGGAWRAAEWFLCQVLHFLEARAVLAGFVGEHINEMVLLTSSE